MVVFETVSTVFDMLTFGALLLLVRADAPLFRTAWFVESLLTELIVAPVVRTRRPFLRSRPSTMMASVAGIVALLAIALPYSPLGALFAFVPLAPTIMLLVVAISVTSAL